ncbi:hypothetical protein ACPCK3_14770 [Streptomyces griseoincarnatus]
MPVGGGFTNCGCGPEATACENPTQPVATVGLCLADGRPIAVTVVMDCSGNVTSEGWIDLTTGAYSVGVPPAGTMACGDARSVEVSGVFCDVDQTSGDVLGLVLIEYQYAADGTVESVRLVDAVTGDTYTPQGEVTTCPAGVEQPEKDLVLLCDTTEDGTVVTFVRDYARDENGTITGFSDYGLDGAPYAPAGTVGVCQCPTSFTTECWEAVEAEARYNTTGGGDCGGISPSSPGCGGDWTITSWIIDGVDVVSTPVTFTAVGCGGDPARFHGAFAAALASLDPDAGWEPAYKDVCLWFVRAPSADPERVYGDLVLEGIRTDGTPYPGTPYTLTPGGTREETRVTKVYARSCTGEITVSWLDEAGVPRDAPAGDLTPCTGTATEPCRNTATLLLCDTDPACEAGGEPTATDEPNPSQYPNWVLGNWCLVQTPGEGAPVWEGGSVVLGPDPACPTSGSGDTMRTIGVQLKAGSPTATAPVPLTVSLRVTNNGPNPGVVGDGRFGLWNAATGTRLTHVNVQNSAPVGHQQTLTLTANVPAAELAAGQIVAVLDVETYQGAGEKAWTVDQFEWSAEVPAAECETQFLRTVVTDCETGETVSTTDTTLDGQPYTPTGEVGQCAAVGGECCPTPPEPQPCRDTSTLLVCDLPPGDSEGDASASDVSTQAANYPFDSDPIRCVNPLPGGGAGLWSGGAGSTVFPPETTASGTCDDRPIGQVLRGVAATLQAPAPDCHDGMVDVTVSARVTNDSPHPAGNNYNGSLRLHRADTGERLALSQSLISTPAATSRTLTATASGIDAALLAGGQLVAVLDVETFDGTNQAGTGNRWTADQFTATYAYGTDGCAVQFLRTVVTDCETGQVVSVTDATMDGQPYTPAGEVGPCQAAGGECCPPPEPAPDTEVVQLCDTVEGAAPVPFLRHLTYEPGSPTPVTVTDTEVDGTTPYTPMGAVGSCTPPCRDTSSTLLCDVASLDTVTVLDTVNRAGADGWQITSFTDGGCTGYNPPDGPIPGPAVWSDGYLSVRADRNLGTVCHGWSGYDTARLRWVLTKTFTAPEDGTAVITADAFRGDGGARVRVNGEDVGLYGQWNQPAAGGSAQVPVTAGPNVVEIEVRDSGGPGWVRGRLDVVMTRTTQFFRRQVTDCGTGEVLSTTDTTLDGQPYTPTGEVGQCEPAGGECCPPPDPAPDAEVVQLCDRVEGADPVPFLRHFTYQPGAATPSTVTDTGLDGVTPYTPAGTVGTCAVEAEPCPARSVLEACRCDDTTGDGIADTDYVELLGVDCDGAVTSLGTWTPDLSEPYTPVAPVECDTAGVEPAVMVRAHRVQVDPGGTWDAAGVPLLQSVTFTAHGGTGMVTTSGGTSTLFAGESVTWSLVRDEDTALVGPLSVMADTGTVTVAYTAVS